MDHQKLRLVIRDFDAIIVTIVEQAEELTTQTTSLLTKIKKATKLEAITLAKLFPSSSKRTVTQAFDPTADCVALPAQKRRKPPVPSQLRLMFSCYQHW